MEEVEPEEMEPEEWSRRKWSRRKTLISLRAKATVTCGKSRVTTPLHFRHDQPDFSLLLEQE
jgi:hypothetical protein